MLQKDCHVAPSYTYGFVAHTFMLPCHPVHLLAMILDVGTVGTLGDALVPFVCTAMMHAHEDTRQASPYLSRWTPWCSGCISNSGRIQ